MDDTKGTSRRNFIKLATAGTLVAGVSRDAFGSMATHLIEPREQQTQPTSPNDKVHIATIGVGGQGMSDTNAALRRTGASTDQANPNPLGPGVEVVAVADLYDGRLTRAQEIWGKQLFITRDYHEILARPDVDAVIVATSDHWHRKIALDAMKAGKDVYLEKPMVQSLDEGKDLIDAARATNRILQVGSQRISSIIYQKAKDSVKRQGCLSIPFVSSVGVTIATTAQVSLVICSCISSLAYTSCSVRLARSASWPPADCATGKMGATCLM